MTELRNASTVLLLRDGSGGVEVLMVRRHTRSGFGAGAWVFPGGVVDHEDCALDPEYWADIDPAALAVRFDEPSALVLGRHVAAARETFEEAGLLLARRADGTPLDGPFTATVRNGEPGTFNQWLAAERLVLDLGALVYFSRWITPEQEPKRYDASFFAAAAPQGQVAAHDRFETTDHRWTTAAAALAAGERGRFGMMYPTIRTMEELATWDSVADLLASARERVNVPPVQPHIEATAAGSRVLHPDDPDYPHHLYEPGQGGSP